MDPIHRRGASPPPPEKVLGRGGKRSTGGTASTRNHSEDVDETYVDLNGAIFMSLHKHASGLGRFAPLSLLCARHLLDDAIPPNVADEAPPLLCLTVSYG